MAEIRAASRAVRQQQILTYLIEKFRKQNVIYVTAYDIARGIGMNPRSPQFRGHLYDMRDRGIICDDTVPNAGKWGTAGYSLPEAARKSLEAAKRKVTVKSKGVPVGQLSFF